MAAREARIVAPSAALAGPTPHDDGNAPSVMAASVITFDSRAKLRLAVLADHVSAHGDGATRRDVDRLLVLVQLGQTNVRDAHAQLATVRGDQQRKAA